MSRGEHDFPFGVRGRWTDAQTFVLEYDGIASNAHRFLHMRFTDDRVEIRVQEITRTLGATFVGRQVKP